MIPELLKSDENYGEFQVMNETSERDEYGSYRRVWTFGVTFEGVLSLNDSVNAQVAAQSGVTGLYTLYYNKEMRLPWHTVFCRVDKPAECYRVTSKDEHSTPSTTAMDMRVVHCEEYEVRDDE